MKASISKLADTVSKFKPANTPDGGDTNSAASGPTLHENSTNWRNHPDATAFLISGYTAWAQNNFSFAIGEFTKAIKVDPSYFRGYLLRGYAHAVQRRWDLALLDVDTASKLNPASADAYRIRGWVREMIGQHDRAIDDCDRAVTMDPLNSSNYIVRGALHLMTRNGQLALSDFNRAVILDPASPDNFWNRGEAFRLLGDKRQFDDFAYAIRLRPCREYFHRRASYYTIQGENQLAIMDLTAELTFAPDSTTYRKRAELYDRLGYHSNAYADRTSANTLDRSATSVASRNQAQRDNEEDHDHPLRSFFQSIGTGAWLRR